MPALPSYYEGATCVICYKTFAFCRCHRAKPNRLRNVANRTKYNGVTYDSKAEAEHAAALTFAEREDMIHAWIRQVTIPLGPDFRTRVDFLVFTAPDVCHCEEVKGKETERFKTVRRLWPKYGPCKLHVLTKTGKVWSREVIHGKTGDE